MTKCAAIFSGMIVALFLLANQSVYADPLESVAKKLAKAMAHYKKDGHVAVLVFPYHDGGLSSGSSLVSEHLTNLMAERKHIYVIERSHLGELLGEMRLEESGAIISTGAAKTGGILTVDAVVTGSLTDSMEGETEVNARLIRVETGEIIAAATTKIERTWQDSPHRPAPPPGEEEKEPEYVMHASPLIFTPTARRGPARPPAESVMAYSAPIGAGAVTMEPTPNVTTVSNNPTVITQPLRPRRRRAPLSADRAQMIYALGATLDVEGQHKAAERFYERVRPVHVRD